MEDRPLGSDTPRVGKIMGRTKGKHFDGTETPASGNHVPATATDTMDKLDIILQEIRESLLAIEQQRLGSLTIELDYTLAVQRRRASFQSVKKQLRAEGLTYALMFPARLRITHNQKAHFFETPELVRDWLDLTFPHSSHKEQSDTLPPRQTRRPRKDKQGRQHPTHRKTGPMLSQVLESQKAAIHSAYSTQRVGSPPGGIASSVDSTVASDSEGSMALFPSITPQTAQEL
ncbi:hypothetical protein NDU88_001694 [Pleurodeles waltl]|uniref:Uncharacterized protein n=1 Tax=Pleurodeles waltl TaxID=8319 RepID=A0AAV7P6I3_PLEWA|nr:hypothetical protein NDU88_001694 [Pleurodeles waltl]